MSYVRFPLSLRNVEDRQFERVIDICHETVRMWWNRFEPLFAGAALDGLCDAIAILQAGAGVSKSPAERRKSADRCRQRIIATGSGLARMVAAGEPLGWELTAIPQTN